MRTGLDRLIKDLRITTSVVTEDVATKDEAGPAAGVSRGGTATATNPGAGRGSGVGGVSRGGPYLGQGWDLTGTVLPQTTATYSFIGMLQGMHPAIAIAVGSAVAAALALGSVLSDDELESIAPMLNEHLENQRTAETDEAGWQGKDLVWDDELKTYRPRLHLTNNPLDAVADSTRALPQIGFNSKSGDTAYLSNFASSLMTGNDGNIYKTAEHAFQASKTTDMIWRQRIIDAPTPAAARALGRQAPLRRDWAEIKVDLMKRILEAKFAQNPTMASQLMATGEADLSHTASWDNFWGTGSSGTGENILGKILMEIRDALIAADRNAPGVTPVSITKLEEGQVFVFGSNTEGRHGLGAAKTAMGFGAEYGKAEGMQGNAYAIPTKDLGSGNLSLEQVEAAVKRFIEFAKNHQRLTFLVTPIGTGLAGFSAEEVAPFFADSPSNVVLPEAFQIRPSGNTVGERATFVPAKDGERNTTTTVVNIKNGGSADVYIGRGSKWGNPYVIGKDGTREDVIQKYEAYLNTRQDLLDAIVPELQGKVLGCYCAPQACHGDLLAEYADNM